MLDLWLIGILSFIAGFLFRDITMDLMRYYVMGFRHGITKNMIIMDTLNEDDLEAFGIVRIEKKND
jgi:hypothetical protein